MDRMETQQAKRARPQEDRHRQPLPAWSRLVRKILYLLMGVVELAIELIKVKDHNEDDIEEEYVNPYVNPYGPRPFNVFGPATGTPPQGTLSETASMSSEWSHVSQPKSRSRLTPKSEPTSYSPSPATPLEPRSEPTPSGSIPATPTPDSEILCNHQKTTTAGSNQFQKRVRCLECGLLLKKEVLVVPAERQEPKAKAIAKPPGEVHAKPYPHPQPKSILTGNAAIGNERQNQNEMAEYQEYLEFKKWRDMKKER